MLPLCNIRRYQYNRTHHRTGGVGPSLPQTPVSTVRRKRNLLDSVEQIVLALRKLSLTFYQSFFVSGSSLSVKMCLLFRPVSSRKHSLVFFFLLETGSTALGGQLWEDSKKTTIIFLFFSYVYILFTWRRSGVNFISIDTALNGRSFERATFHQCKRRRFRCRASSSNVRSSSVL